MVSMGLGFLVGSAQAEGDKPSVKIIYPKKSKVDLDEMAIEGELKRPGEFYFKTRPPEKFDSLVKRRANFHREMLRDAVMTR